MEEDDAQTLKAARAAGFGQNVQFVLVPNEGPRTKPKALNYALQFARGEYVVVYDAEDRPEPDQLRRALHAFAAHGEEIFCIQARLGIYNSQANWLTRQFTMEYAALFDALLPMLDADRLPIPLGGTSNHFRTRALMALGGWDAFNVTEDADLGYRMARHGYRGMVLDSTTHEQACSSLPAWMRQRTRWMKGWMQTYCVHMRNPARLWRELGPMPFLTFQLIMGGQVISALAHPLFLLAVLVLAVQGNLLAPSATPWGQMLLTLNIANLGAGYAAAILLGAAGLHARNLWRYGVSLATMPVYWLLISAATYRACWQLATDPFNWEKTDHPDTRFTLARNAGRRPVPVRS